MKGHRTSRQLKGQIALASGLVMLFAGCQVAAPTNDMATDKQLSNGKATATNTNTADKTAQPVPDVEPDAKVTGVVTDPSGKPLANVAVNTFHGFSSKTGEDGKFSIDVKAQDELRLDFGAEGYLDRQMFVGSTPGSNAELEVTMKPLDTKITPITAAEGGTATSSDGKAILEVPPGALLGDTKVRLTWMDPIPSKEFPESYGQLPGPLVTRTLPDGSAQGENYEIPPIAFTDVQLIGENLAPGAQATLRMKVNPEAMKLADGKVDFNNPATLQQPCYDFDRALGIWVNPATSKLEKDANGDVWFVYTLRGAEAAPKYKALSHVVDTQTIYWTTLESERYWGYKPGGGWQWLTRWVNVQHSYTYNIYGSHAGGKVLEESSNKQLDGRGVPSATVYHSAAWNTTSSGTDGSGNFDVPLKKDQTTTKVTSVSWNHNGTNNYWNFNKSISAGAVLNINTNGNVTGKLTGGSTTYTATNSNLGAGTVGEGNFSKSGVSRDTKFMLNDPADDSGDPIYLAKDGKRKVTPSGTVPVKGTYNFGSVDVIRDLAGHVTEQSVGGWNDKQPNKPVAPFNFDGVKITNFTDRVDGSTSDSSNASGNFGFSLLANAGLPKVHAEYNSKVKGDFGGTKAIDINYPITLNTDSSYTLKLGGVFLQGENGSEKLSVTYKVDGVEYTRDNLNISSDGTITMKFVRDKSDDTLNFQLIAASTPSLEAVTPFPQTSIGTGGSGNGTAQMQFKSGAVKYHQ